MILKKNVVIDEISAIINYTTNSVEVVIYDRCGYGDKYDKLFCDPYRLISHDAIDINDDSEQNVMLKFDNLIAENVSIPVFGTSRYNSVLELIKFFRNMGFISNLSIGRGTMSFTYAMRGIKQLLTKSGRILEVFTYHKARKIGYFDDVSSSLEVKWGSELNIRNEFDCIMNKRFQDTFCGM